ncbi:MAG: flagellar assembly protein FliH [Oceanospirillaceae bacterium]|nr:flagellar assembly protein FliH [Oceanospirillaceae bacterium]MCP5350087.1 flagellar assembly protein FliH [Oceanospirillaceae bacterium]
MADKDRIPAEEALDARPWSLPYWQGAPVVKPVKKPEPQPAVSEDDSEEIELEITPLTAEQLEEIRRDAYNEGLEQGLVEGRQKGEKTGYDKGFEQGKKEGYGKGFEEGKEAGFNAGEKKAEREGKQRTDEQVKQLTAVMFALLDPIDNQQAELSQSVHDLVVTLAKAVVGAELNQGSEHILTLVKRSLKALPVGSQNIRVYVHSADFPYLEEAAQQTELNWKPCVDDSLEPGGCRLQTEHSLLDYTRSERLAQVLKDFEHQFAETADLALEPETPAEPQAPADSAMADEGIPIDDGTASAAEPPRAAQHLTPTEIEDEQPAADNPPESDPPESAP